MQTTIPFIDAQPVTPRDGVWLSGVGLYHKGHPGEINTYYEFSMSMLSKDNIILKIWDSSILNVTFYSLAIYHNFTKIGWFRSGISNSNWLKGRIKLG
jgi:hypothetical protein